MHLLFGRFIGGSSKEGENTSSSLVTIGGTGSNSTNKNKVQTKDGPFKRRHDNNLAEEPVLWPEPYINEQSTVVKRTVYAKDVGPEAISLDSIAGEIVHNSDIDNAPTRLVHPTKSILNNISMYLCKLNRTAEEKEQGKLRRVVFLNWDARLVEMTIQRLGLK
ncbi:hypothetical protein BHE90_005899 [Fusarium euwallaceae]|uniref:Uncharacterized protein n=1 Tax=Fusarium euwallaceae TaxID=1147111 RepID=A0A430LV86_9HYPO|nr:hypothetical protein BHE90_005899 [Fusarium euwallaceae]